ncbi:MAG: recombinase family protein [Planctomycetes bacterium]|nr:recombinase family protein [Planctomycetota bacterium]
MKYLLYARKSSESEDRQVQSIDDPVNRLKKLAKDQHLNIAKIYTEAKSAKQPDARPHFDQMLQSIESGEAEGILCWQINRLSRNPIDSARVQWLLQQNILKSIQTIDREYLPSDNVLLFNVESGIANQYILDLRKNTLRGTLSKLEKGGFPNHAPIGYLNDKEEKIVLKDLERFSLIRKMWGLMLTGRYTPPQILKIVNSEWGLRTLKTRKSGGKELSRSNIYNIFGNLFYAGIIKYNESQYEGKHEKMITLNEYDRVQFLLGRRGRPRPKKHKFAFTGLIRCSECGCFYTAETKTKRIKSTGEIRSYTYYHCTRRSRTIKCSQRKVLREENLEKQIEEEINKWTILPEFRDWALKILNTENDKEIEERKQIHKTRCNTVLDTQNQIDNLTKMRYRNLIDDGEYLRERKLLQSQLASLKQNLRETEERAVNWLELTENTFHFATHAREAFINGGMDTKKDILMALGQNPTIKDGKLYIEANEWLVPIINDYPELEEEYLRLEPLQVHGNKERTELFAPVRLAWLPGEDSNLQ